MKKILLSTLTFIFTLFNCYSQDVITKKTGEDIKAKILEITSTEVKYKRFDNLIGPIYSINKSEVLLIKYENGTKDIFSQVDNVVNNQTNMEQGIKPAPKNKAVVYFVRPSSYGLLINFSYFDSTKFIGKFKGPNYIRYECEPGIHLFWARSENKDFIEADVEEGKIYFIEAIPITGAIKAGVQLVPINPRDPKVMKQVMNLVNKKPSESFTVEYLESETKNLQDLIVRGIDLYKKEKSEGEVFSRLDRTMYYKP